MELLKQQQQENEHHAIRLLGELDSVSAAIKLRLKLPRPIIKEALSKPRRRHSVQINLLGILRGARYKNYYKGTLLPTWCPNMYHIQVCGRTDTFNHMLANLRSQLAKGPAAIDFLEKKAKGPLP